MRINLKDIIHRSDGSIPFEFTMDLSDLCFNGSYPIQNPVKAEGKVVNNAGALTLYASVATVLQLQCDRCLKEFSREKVVEVESLVADHLDNELSEENDEILLMEGTELDLEDALRTAFILDMDTKILCSEDCKGLCAQCGADLNLGPCKCGKEIDPRLAVLAKLLEEKK